MTVPAIGITSGDPAGIGPELVLRLLARPSVSRPYVPVVFADAAVLARVAGICSLPAPEHVVPVRQWLAQPVVERPTVVDCSTLDAAAVQPGHVDAACGRAAYRYLEACVAATMAGHLHAMTTAPIHKESLRMAGVPHAGHTEILTALTGARRSCMMLTSERLTVSFVTTHVGYADVPSLLSPARIHEVIELSAAAMHALRGRAPRMVVCGLNPHAGENGLFGAREEEELIGPAVEAARDNGFDVVGPVSPDAVFLPRRLAETDCIICMYHDQGHIPFKLLAWDTGVNVTLGLPIIRTSVDHGTAFDIAWKGVADPTSLSHAVDLAIRLIRNQATEERTR